MNELETVTNPGAFRVEQIHLLTPISRGAYFTPLEVTALLKTQSGEWENNE